MLSVVGLEFVVVLDGDVEIGIGSIVQSKSKFFLDEASREIKLPSPRRKL